MSHYTMASAREIKLIKELRLYGRLFAFSSFPEKGELKGGKADHEL